MGVFILAERAHLANFRPRLQEVGQLVDDLHRGRGKNIRITLGGCDTNEQVFNVPEQIEQAVERFQIGITLDKIAFVGVIITNVIDGKDGCRGRNGREDKHKPALADDQPGPGAYKSIHGEAPCMGARVRTLQC